ncbi:MAG: hypothetical protein O7H41_10170 [Planctomycetota bacterium]|nr:hypothetical protein [Planctomycetota bacterium]
MKRPRKRNPKPPRPTLEDSRRGGLARKAQIREGDELRKALARGDLVPAEEQEDSGARCPLLMSSQDEARRRAGLEPKKRKYIDVPPEREVPSGLLELQRMDPAQRARLLAD